MFNEKGLSLLSYLQKEIVKIVVKSLDDLKSDIFYKMKQLVETNESKVSIKKKPQGILCCLRQKPLKIQEINNYGMKEKYLEMHKLFKTFKKNLHTILNDERLTKNFFNFDLIKKSMEEYFNNKVESIFQNSKLNDKLKNEVDNYWEYFNVRRVIEKQEKILKSQNRKLSKLEDAQTSKDCIICMESNRSVVFHPCLHLICCESCGFSKVSSDCPQCHGEIEKKQIVHC